MSRTADDSVSSTLNDIPNTSALKCRICDAPADGQHFGTSACRACAAFFRRTVSRQLRYICRYDNDCDIFDQSRSICRDCRLKKCLAAGMNERAVRSQQTEFGRRAPRRKVNLPDDGINSTKDYDDNNENVPCYNLNKRPRAVRVQPKIARVEPKVARVEPNVARIEPMTSTSYTAPPLVPLTTPMNISLSHNIIGNDLTLTAAAKSSPPPPPLQPTTPVTIFDPSSWTLNANTSYFATDSLLAFAPAISPEMGSTNSLTYSTLPMATSTANMLMMPLHLPPPGYEISVESLTSPPNSTDYRNMTILTKPNVLIVSEADEKYVGTKVGPEYYASFTALPESTSSSTSNLSAASPAHKRRLLHSIVEKQATDFFFNERTLPFTHPTIAKMELAYECLQRRRDVCFSRIRMCDDHPTRVYVCRQVFDVYQYWKNIHEEIEWVAEMLSTFDKYSLIPTADKVQIFKHYWIHFIILERNFDTYRILGTASDDLRMVFANGDINDVIVGEYDVKGIAGTDTTDVKTFSHPWFKTAAYEILKKLKRLQPSETEMMYCLALMFWQLSHEVEQKVSANTAQIAEHMKYKLYKELEDYYSTSEVFHRGRVQRVSELVQLIGITERLVLQRKEDMVMQRTFKHFKVDLYMEEIFESSSD